LTYYTGQSTMENIGAWEQELFPQGV